MFIREGVILGGKELSIETGKIAKQADGAVVIRYGETVVFVSAVASDSAKEDDFLPLTVDYSERMYAAGRIPGSYFRREARPAAHEILACRLIDRPIRPLFPDAWCNETQVIAMVLSSDGENSADVLAITGASVALTISSIPWQGPIAGIRVGRVNGKLIANPTQSEQTAGDLNIVVACSRDALVMVEGECKFISEADMVEALEFAQKQAMPIIELQEQLRQAIGKEKRVVVESKIDTELVAKISQLAEGRLAEAIAIREKQQRSSAVSEVKKWIISQLGEAYAEREAEVKTVFDDLKRRYVRQMVIEKQVRLDGRKTNEIRPIWGEVGVLPRPHGSALFTRGETQALAVTTLATSRSDQRIESVMGDFTKNFMLHYNFPPFSTNEVKRFGAPGRREIGHGFLAERSIQQVLPSFESFPYVVRIVSEIMESNGSSSMATVCGGSMALMDAGVPITAPVAGIAMGLIKEGDRFAVLSDILGDEDHLGDMDFKVTGTKDGICAIQMDIKLDGLPGEVLAQALNQAREGRMHILGKMAEVIDKTRPNLSPNAPRILTIRINPDRIRDVIGQGGKTIRALQEQTGTEINITDDGTVNIASTDERSAQKAVQMIEALTAEPEVGTVYLGRIKRIKPFGVFVEILPGVEGMCPREEMTDQRVNRIEDICQEGDEIVVKMIAMTRQGVRLSHLAAENVPEEQILKML